MECQGGDCNMHKGVGWGTIYEGVGGNCVELKQIHRKSDLYSFV